MFKTEVKNLLEDALAERSDLFLIELTIDQENQIRVVIDGDQGVLVKDCVFISKSIEQHLDKEALDFSLEVMSAGATAPLVHKRQYKKNLNRVLKVKTGTDKIEGKLTNTTDTDILLEWKVREPKPIGKGKVTVKKQISIAYEDIREAKVMIKF